MKTFQNILGGLLLLGFGVGLRAENQLDGLDRLVGQWMALRQAVAVEEREGRELLDQYAREQGLLQAEAAQLREELEVGQDGSRTGEQEKAEWLSRQEVLTKSVVDLGPVLDRTEAELRVWAPRIPPALRPPLEVLLARLPENSRVAAQVPVSERCQTVVALLTGLEELQNNWHRVTEVLDTEEGRRQVEVLYLGLAQAFAVAPGDTWAALGHPGPAGWRWTPAPQQAGAIRRALRLYARDETADLVILPVQLAPEVAP